MQYTEKNKPSQPRGVADCCWPEKWNKSSQTCLSSLFVGGYRRPVLFPDRWYSRWLGTRDHRTTMKSQLRLKWNGSQHDFHVRSHQKPPYSPECCILAKEGEPASSPPTLMCQDLLFFVLFDLFSSRMLIYVIFLFLTLFPFQAEFFLSVLWWWCAFQRVRKLFYCVFSRLLKFCMRI